MIPSEFSHDFDRQAEASAPAPAPAPAEADQEAALAQALAALDRAEAQHAEAEQARRRAEAQQQQERQARQQEQQARQRAEAQSLVQRFGIVDKLEELGSPYDDRVGALQPRTIAIATAVAGVILAYCFYENYLALQPRETSGEGGAVVSGLG